VSRKASPTLIGAFVLGAIVLLVTGITLFGTGVLFKDSTTYVMYFSGDVSGLRVGAPVTFRGVPLGEVTAIRASILRRGDRLETRVAVYSELTPEAIVQAAGTAEAEEDPDEDSYRLLIENGLRAQLQWQSLVTGQLFVQLDFHEDQPAIFVGGDPSVREIPTIPTPLEIVTETVRHLIERVGELPLEEIIQNLNRTLDGVAALIESGEAQSVLANLDAAVSELRGAIGRLDGRVGEVTEGLEGTLRAATGTLEEIQGVVGAIGEGSQIQYELQMLVREATQAAKAMQNLADSLEQRPESLLTGKRPGGGS
jgi:paraquat-inducible protein B